MGHESSFGDPMEWTAVAGVVGAALTYVVLRRRWLSPWTETKASSEILQSLKVQPWDVLGMQGTNLSANFQLVTRSTAPDERVAFADPAGMPYIRSNSPMGAGKTSRAIYDYVGMSKFPESVRRAITEPTHAKFHAYPPPEDSLTLGPQGGQVIHVVGPDLREPTYDSVDKARSSLTAAYTNVLREFCEAAAADGELATLRLLPISRGVFSGAFAAELPGLTMEAIDLGYQAQPAPHRRRLGSSQVELCIFLESEYDAYVAAHARAAGAGAV